MSGALRSAWILGPRPDGVFVLGAPVLALLVILPLSWWIPSEAIWLAVMTFGSVGHHVPGFLRTYADRSLFSRYRARFVVAPIVVFAAAWWFAGHDLHAVLLVSLVWSIWHGMMQHYGFMRVYDAKAGVIDRKAARMDLAVTVSWFALCLCYGSEQVGSILEGLASVGLFGVPPALVRAAGPIALLVTAAITTAYLLHQRARYRRGEPVSVQKLVLLVSTAALLWFARVFTTDPFLSVALFEVLHDVQYLAIVWAFNRRVVDRGGGGGPLARALFRGGLLAPLLYIGLCGAWGGLAWFAHGLGEPSALERGLTALLVTSGLLHFYYDGFIWKVRQRAVRSGLAVGTQDADDDDRGRPRRDLLHLSIFVAVLAALYRSEQRADRPSDLQSAEAMLASVPDSMTARRNLGAALATLGRVEEAEAQLRAAVQLAPRVVETHLVLARLLIDTDPEAAKRAARAALAIDPSRPQAHVALAGAEQRLGQLPAAKQALRTAIALGDESAETLGMLGLVLARTSDHDEARRYLQRASLAAPHDVRFPFNLGLSYAGTGEWSEAMRAFERATELAPSLAAAHNSLGAAYLQLGRRADAERSLQTALRLDPGLEHARRNLEQLQRTR